MISNDIYRLNQPLQSRIIALLDESKTELPDLICFETKRTELRQAQLYGKGRNKAQMMWAYPTKSCFWVYDDPSATKVTWTTKSNHLTGDACDFAFKTNGRITWTGDWARYLELAEKNGLVSLKPLELCHLELNPNFMPEQETKQTIPDWATEAVKKAKDKGIVTTDFMSNMTVFRFCVILDKLGLLNK